jgi:hypothetical protein
MIASTVIPDLGLDPRKLPDLTDPATRKRLSPTAIEAFFKIVQNWDLKNEDAMALLGGVSHGRYYDLKRSRKGVFDPGRTYPYLSFDRNLQVTEHPVQSETGESMDFAA